MKKMLNKRFKKSIFILLGHRPAIARAIAVAVALVAALTIGACSAADSTGTPGETAPAQTASFSATPAEAAAPTQTTPTGPATMPAAEATVTPQPAATETAGTPAGGQDSGGAGTEQPPHSNDTRRPLVFPKPGLGLEPVAQGFNQPVGLENAADGSNRLFVLEQAGLIRIIQDGQILETPFLDIQEKVNDEGSEQGLLGLAFHPDYEKLGFFFINYTDTQGDSIVARYQVSEDPNLADAGSEEVLLHIDQPYANHNGGGVVFGPDGFLYLSFGDGGSAGDPQGNAQSLDTLLGKILRIDVTRSDPYGIPPENPFAGGTQQPEIWAYGLRNPWRFSFDRQTGDMFIADVGQNMWEEINFVPAGSPGGSNFGWDFFEGTHPFEGAPPAGKALVEPVYEYDHSRGCSVTGGVVYRGQALEDWQGIYLFGDYCSGLLWGLIQDQDGGWQAQVLLETDLRISSFGEDESGEVYVVDHGGVVYRLAGAAP